MEPTSPKDNTHLSNARIDALTERFLDNNVLLRELVDGVKAEATARERKVDSINRFTKVAVGLIALTLVALFGVGWILVSNNQDAKDRSVVATNQRTEQAKNTAEVLHQFQLQKEALGAAQVKQDSNAAATAWCARTSDTITEYKACLAPYGIKLTEVK